MAHYLICYDIADPRRLGRIHRRIVKDALFIQFSVYYLQGELHTLKALLAELQKIIDERYDDVRVYSIRPLAEAQWLGRHWVPEGIGLFV